jgi:hypothetical protein
MVALNFIKNASIYQLVSFTFDFVFGENDVEALAYLRTPSYAPGPAKFRPMFGAQGL